jgi:dolichyl-diphosphooligosaccharide--protein glycosyltransferase
MQFTSVFIYRVLDYLSSSFEQLKWIAMSLNDVCVYVPVWFGCVATSLLGLLTYECTGKSITDTFTIVIYLLGSANGAVVASAIMAIIPAHLMRSVGGGYDNESIAMSAMLATFYFWCRSLRSDQSWAYGILTGKLLLLV